MEAEISALGTVQRSQRGRLRDFQVALQAQMKLKTITCNDRLQHAWLYGFFPSKCGSHEQDSRVEGFFWSGQEDKMGRELGCL